MRRTANTVRTLALACACSLVQAMTASAQTCELGAELLPFVPAAGWPNGHQGFVRLVNPRDQSAAVPFTAYDDAGNAYDLRIRLGPRETLHFNSADLQDGNSDKGELTGTGSAPVTGHWWLCFPPRSDAVETTAYIRTGDGFLTDMTPSVAYAGRWACSEELCAEWRVPIFNPASNLNQASRLRLINNSAEDVAVVITGFRGDGSQNVDEDGQALTVSGMLAASTVQEISAEELETGVGLGQKLSPATDDDGETVPLGSLGPGRGKWQLLVRSRGLLDSGELVIVNLMATPTGHVTNLSADSVDAWSRR
ncbi:MAG: hypothetical protein OXI79_15305 [Gammaproteobacteria bacterium]|nr:hypothetical protein [Gammaproteobacteria bacterium]